MALLQTGLLSKPTPVNSRRSIRARMCARSLSCKSSSLISMIFLKDIHVLS